MHVFNVKFDNQLTKSHLKRQLNDNMRQGGSNGTLSVEIGQREGGIPDGGITVVDGDGVENVHRSGENNARQENRDAGLTGNAGVRQLTAIQGLTNRRILPLTAVQRPSTAPLLPTVETTSWYKSCERLAHHRLIHRHHLILQGEHGKKKQWNKQGDAGRWSKLKKIYERINVKMADLNLREKTDEQWKEAARWLDVNERKNQSPFKYVQELRKNYNYKPRPRK